MDNKTDCCTDVLLSYIGMDMAYKQGKLMHIDGKEDAAEGDLGTLEYPRLGLTLDPQEPDPVLFSYLYTSRIRPRPCGSFWSSSTPLPGIPHVSAC